MGGKYIFWGKGMNWKHFFEPGDRYRYDFGPCSARNGYAQVDTGQDAAYFGTWISPTQRKITCYCEGDITVFTADSDIELVEEVARIKSWSQTNGWGFHGIDSGLNETLESDLRSAGLGEYIH